MSTAFQHCRSDFPDFRTDGVIAISLGATLSKYKQWLSDNRLGSNPIESINTFCTNTMYENLKHLHEGYSEYLENYFSAEERTRFASNLEEFKALLFRLWDEGQYYQYRLLDDVDNNAWIELVRKRMKNYAIRIQNGMAFWHTPEGLPVDPRLLIAINTWREQ